MSNFNIIGIKDSDKQKHKFVMVIHTYGFAMYRNNDLCMVERKNDVSEGVIKTLLLLGFSIKKVKINEHMLNKQLKGIVGFPEKFDSLVDTGAIIDYQPA